MSSYFPAPDADDDPLTNAADEVDMDSRTRLDKTIDKIGMGSYQWTLLCLCGFGWMADNMWLQAVAIILPRVQQHYSVPDSQIGILSSSMFAGMMIGAVGWGTGSDLLGRSTAFNATLFFTALFGILSSFAYSFPSLCLLLFLLGSAVGGSMPTDGTLLLEHMPQHKLYLVTALSFFFSLGSVLAAVVALILVPSNSCISTTVCDPALNNGWRHLLTALGVITLAMFLARIVFFRLHESPRYLVHAGRPEQALETLQLIARFNGSSTLAGELKLADVDDTAVVIDDGVPDGYESIASDPAEPRSKETRYFASWAQRWLARFRMVLIPQWRRTTLLVWGAWCGMALAYTMFNVFLPKLLESDGGGDKSISDSLWDVLVFTLGGCPGALLGARLILTPLGRRWSLASSTLVTAGFCILFIFAQSAGSVWATRISAIGIGLASTTMWAVLYGWTPEIFATQVRGTACGIASALSRVGGIIAPLIGGLLLLFSRAAPVYASMLVFVIAAVCVLGLAEDEGEGGKAKGGHTRGAGLMH
ncbi:MFS general substrate transporter [Mycena indigotica]|uniref:MFS general substrate transporter n=1 Tax=Mycena indigotica TaxID=2126181 RepID=A0A8H6SFP2_9AGAR|nr:MFS general substrate transporter [Mycena indigotica]KAF7298678.1 MFS general substrate transporter [Mycena indigotica]